jgi:hypothetical protein
MGIFYTRTQRALPVVKNAIEDALKTDPKNVANLDQEAAQRALQVDKTVSSQFNWVRFVVAGVICLALLGGAIWTSYKNMPDISKSLMSSFTAFSGIILGLLGGEAQKA